MPGRAAARSRRRRSFSGPAARSLTGLCLVLLAAGAAGAQPSGPGAPAPAGVPVRLDGEIVFEVRSPLGPFTAENRARATERRLVRIAEDPFYSAALFAIREAPGTATVSYREETVGVVTGEDAARLGSTPGELAAGSLQRPKEAITRYRARRVPEAWLRRVLLLGAATLLLVGLLVSLQRMHRRLAARAEAQPGGRLPRWIRDRLTVRGHELASIELRGLRLLRTAITAGLHWSCHQAPLARSTVPLGRASV
jgi:hypothetical protein